MSLHKCLHGQIFMNNFPPAFITHRCRKVRYVYWPSDAMWCAGSLWLFKRFLLRSIIYLFFLSLTEREQRSERFVFLCSSLGIEGQSKVPFLVVLDCSLFVWSACPIVFSDRVCLCVCVRKREREGGRTESSSPTQRERDGESKLMFTVLSQRMRAPCSSAQLWAEKLKQPKTYAHLCSGEGGRERGSRKRVKSAEHRTQWALTWTTRHTR